MCSWNQTSRTAGVTASPGCYAWAMARRTLIPAAILATAALPGCANHHSASSLLSEEFRPVSQAVPARVIYGELGVAENRVREFVLEDGGEEDAIVRQTCWIDLRQGGYTLERELIRADQQPVPLGTRWLDFESGAVVLLRTLNPDRDIQLIFDPPLVVCPAVLESEHASSTEVREVASGKTGEARWTIELLGERVTAAGETQLLVRSFLEIRLGSSTVRRRTDRIIQKTNSGSGEPLQEESLESVSVFGLTVRSESEKLRARPD